MDLSLSPADIAFRNEIRAFLDANVPPSLRHVTEATTGIFIDPQIAIQFHRALYRKGWSVPHWPVEHGGTGWSPVQRYIFEVECGLAGAPAFNGAGAHFVGPVLMRFGTEEQKRFYLPRIRSGEDIWAQGYSEPGSGSDLASLKTRAESDGDDYIVTGQKIWTTFAHRSNRIFALVRTSREGKRQEGITFLLIDLTSPGITIRPIIGNGGDHEFNEVFFDQVRVPKANRVGDENKGWDVAKYLLEFERGGNFVAGRARAHFAKVVALIRARAPDDPDIAAQMAEIGIDLDAMEMLELSVLSATQTGANPGPKSSLLKLRWSEIRQAICELALNAIGEDALRWIDQRPLSEAAQLPPEEEEVLAIAPRYFNSRAYSIMGGTSEIQTNILAKLLLGL
jgi:acyl-CoA dehydrogenase